MRFFSLAAALVPFTLLTGCAAPAKTAAPAHVHAHGHGHSHGAHAHNPSDHNHDRGHMMLSTDGQVTALLTAHLSSKTGNEVDIFVERSGKPLALAVTTLDGTATVGARTEKLSFACAPANERPPGEADGACSHFVALVHWMKPTDVARVESGLPVDGANVAMVWRNFEPRRYAHHVE